MPVHVCPECGTHMAVTRREERPGPDPALETPDEADIDLAAEDVDRLEEISMKAATLLCQRCGCAMTAPDL